MVLIFRFYHLDIELYEETCTSLLGIESVMMLAVTSLL